MPTLFRSALAALFLSCLAALQPALAATISRGGDGVMGCRLTLEGQIQEGDADRLRAILDEIGHTADYTPHGRRICLDSPGGFLREALRMADLIGEWAYGTAVPEGASCESACAVVFLAGRYRNPEAGGAFVNDRILHPRGRLGFHAPSLLLGDRAYTRDEVDTAYAIALDSMAGVLRHRADRGTAIPDSLFLSLLGTPPNRMAHVETVGQAARWQIAVAPVDFPAGNVTQALSHACRNVDSGLLDYSVADYAQTPLEFSYDALTDDSLTAFSSREFRYEGSAQCELRIYASGSFNDGNPVLPLGGARYTGGATDQDVSGSVFAYMLYPPDQRIDALPVARAGDTSHASAFFRAAQSPAAGAVQGGLTSCRLTGRTARVINVNEFVNLRAAPGLRAPVVGRLRLAEEVQVPDVGLLMPVRNNARGPTCVSICDGLARSPSDVGLKQEAEGCIADNMLWYQVVDRTGNTGFVSRHFLAE